MGIDVADDKVNGDEAPTGSPAATTRSSATSRPTARRTADGPPWRPA
ncbi:MAG: hypothetical protein R2734_15565 [Nocardioides sp.]